MNQPKYAFRAAELIYSRKNPMYAEQWREYELLSLVDIVRGKAVRVKQAVKEENYEDATEELLDVMNYAAFAWCKVQERVLEKEGSDDAKV